MENISGVELLLIMNKEFPELKNFKDYWVGMHVDDETGDTMGTAFIVSWAHESVEPTVEELDNLQLKYWDDILALREDERMKAEFPNLSARQVWLMALDIGITKQSVIDMVSEQFDPIEAARIVIEITEPPLAGYERFSPVVETIRIMNDIPEDQFNDLWKWARGK